MVELRCRLMPAASKVIMLKASKASDRQTYILTDWYLVLHFAPKNRRTDTAWKKGFTYLQTWFQQSILYRERLTLLKKKDDQGQEILCNSSRYEDPVLAKKLDPGRYTSNEGRFFKVFWMNILDNFKRLFCFHTIGVRRTTCMWTCPSFRKTARIRGSRAYRGRLTPKKKDLKII